MIDLNAASFLVQWAAGGWLFLWVTTRRREVGLGYGWLMRIVYLALAAGSLIVSWFFGAVPVRDGLVLAMVFAGTAALAVSIQRKAAGVAGQRERVERRSQEVADMTGIDRDVQHFDKGQAEFPPWIDLVPALLGFAALIPAGIDAGDPALLSIVRLVVGAAFLGAVTDAMLLGHWYLVQPGLARGPLLELVRWTALLWPLELLVLLWPTGMWSAIDGSIDDGYNGLLTWFWIASTLATIILVGVCRAALRERQYSAVMAATGLLYLAILMAFGMDLVARAILAG
ncbi:MAG: hypothetical protein HKN26_05505 [Acidimicrobiales bacterium]|nr:hypothetical protein [Acidimicrobiales bacterium]